MNNWDQYWAHGFLTSCADAFRGNYEGDLRSVWERYFRGLAKGARILDVCTGNGAIAVIASEVSRATGKQFEIDGVDRARIHPELALRDDPDSLSHIRFHGQVAAERMPFPDDCFHAVTGQYALEYTDVGPTLRELARIMRPAATALFVMHHRDSVIMRTTREELGHVRLIFDEARLFTAARELISRVAAAATPEERQALAHDPDAEQCRYRLNEAARQVSEALRNSPHPEMLRNALSMVRQAYEGLQTLGLEQSLQRLESAQQELQANAERLRDLQAAALAPESAQSLLAELRRLGFNDVSLAPLRHDGEQLIGWTLTFSNPA